MADIEDGFRRALAKFSTRLTKNEEQSFQFATLEEARNALAIIQGEQRKRKENMNLTRLQSFLEAMEQFSKTLELFLNVSPFVAFIWGPMKFLLQVASSWAHAFDTLLGAYEQIGENMPLLERYRDLFKDNPHVQRALAAIYDDILEFHRKALRLFSRPTWKQLFRSTWSDFKTSFQHIVNDLRRHKDLIESEANIVEYQEAQAHRTQAFQSLRTLLDTDRQTKLVSVVDWLSISDVRTDHDAATMVREEYPTTGTWIRELSSLKAWQEDDIPPNVLFWIYGIPGAGKTILASSLIENQFQMQGQAATVLYFYCKSDDSTKNSFLSIGRTLLGQLLQQNIDILLPILYERMIESCESSLRSLRYCQELLDLALQSVGRTYIFVDGLDELDPAQRRQVTPWLVSRVQSYQNQEPGRCRVLFVSQEENDIKRSLSMATTLRITGSDIEPDIRTYVELWGRRIQEKFHLEDEKCKYLKQTTAESSHGMFLYAKLVMQNLYSQASLKNLLFEMQPRIFPKGLEQAYERVVKRVYENPNTAEGIEARRLLNWTVCAKRPLRWHEIQGAVAIDLDAGEVDIKSHLAYDNAKEICGSLVNVLKDNSVTLVHGTARQ
ncbi:MAG: hypothetical protein Q9227_004239 [Pyrenula ochraceoflavens]